MKQIAAIIVCLLIAVAPALAIAPASQTATADECTSCACGANTCCAESNERESDEQPAAPAPVSKRLLSPATAQSDAVQLPELTQNDATFDRSMSDSRAIATASLFLRNCAFLI